MKYQVEEEKADTESKIAMKKGAIQASDESIQLHEDEQKSLQEKLKSWTKKNRIWSWSEKTKGDSKGTRVNKWN